MSNSTPPIPESHPPRAPRRRLSPSTRAAISSISGWTSLFLCVAALASLVTGFGQMQAHAAAINATQPAVHFAWPPLAGLASADPVKAGAEPLTWINAEIRADLEHTLLSKLNANPFDRASLTAAHDALALTGWFREDLKLTRDADGMVHVGATWRVPNAAVRWAGEDHLVTSLGELLPVTYRADASGYKVIVGVRHEPPMPGQPWLGGDVQAGLKLLALLSTSPGSGQIAAVDVSEFSPGRAMTVVTDLGNRILWGGPVDEFNPGQAPPAAKLARLAQLYREQGRIDASRSVLDIRLVDGVYIHDTANAMSRANLLTQDPKSGAKPDKSSAQKSKKTASR